VKKKTAASAAQLENSIFCFMLIKVASICASTNKNFI